MFCEDGCLKSKFLVENRNLVISKSERFSEGHPFNNT